MINNLFEINNTDIPAGKSSFSGSISSSWSTRQAISSGDNAPKIASSASIFGDTLKRFGLFFFCVKSKRGLRGYNYVIKPFSLLSNLLLHNTQLVTPYA